MLSYLSALFDCAVNGIETAAASRNPVLPLLACDRQADLVLEDAMRDNAGYKLASSVSHPAKHLNNSAVSPKRTERLGVRPSCTGQRQIAPFGDHLPPRHLVRSAT
jgi:hypothetical protein